MKLSLKQTAYITATRKQCLGLSQRGFADRLYNGMYGAGLPNGSDDRDLSMSLGHFSPATIYGAVRRIDKALAADSGKVATNKGTTNSAGYAKPVNRKFRNAVSA